MASSLQTVFTYGPKLKNDIAAPPDLHVHPHSVKKYAGDLAWDSMTYLTLVKPRSVAGPR
jgi:hypothetical protein